MSSDASAEPLARSIESILRSIPERWTDVDHDVLSRTEQQALFLLVAAGLVELRIGVRGEFAGEGPTIEFTIDATGEYGVVEALDPVVAEMWTKWGPAFEAWKASDAKESTPFRFTRTGHDRWRLTDQGVIARGDLDIRAPSEGAAAFVGSFQHTIEYVTRTGHQADRPSVRGEGRLVELKAPEANDDAKPTPSPVSLANPEEVAAAFRAALLPEILAALKGQTSPRPSDDSPKPSQVAKPQDHGGDRSGDAMIHVGGPHPDEHDDRLAWWLGKRIYLGRDTQVSRLFWLLARPVGRSCPVDEVQLAVDGVETSERVGSSADEIKAAAVRMRKVMSKLRDRLRESYLDHHVVIHREGGDETPAYTMVLRHDRG